MRLLGLNGSPRAEGNTAILVQTVLSGAAEKGAHTDYFDLNTLKIDGCQACNWCKENDGCRNNDDMQQLYPLIKECDVIVLGSPIYMWQMTAQTKAFVDRLYAFFRQGKNILGSRKMILAYTQGQPDANVFMPYITDTARMFSFLGYQVVDTIVAGGLHAPKAIFNQPLILDRARNAGIKVSSQGE